MSKHYMDIFGTDALGMETLSRLIYEARTSLMIGFVGVSIAAVISMSIGLIAEYFGGWVQVQAVIMRYIDAMIAFSLILMALTHSALLGRGFNNVMIELRIGLVPAYAR